MKTRLDQLLVDKKLITSKSQARSLIKEGKVLVNGKIVDKPGRPYNSDVAIEIHGKTNYVGRGARKLEAAIQQFQISPKKMIIADVGASTGGFTDYLLQNGAQKSYAIDVGSGQLAPKLLQDHRVINMEGTDIRTAKLPEEIDLAVVDLSYISLKLVLKGILNLLKDDGQALILFKPQFECGPEIVNKKGIILDPEKRKQVLKDFLQWAKDQEITITSYIESPVQGKGGNIEYFLQIKKEALA